MRMFLALLLSLVPLAGTAAPKGCVILLHGLARSEASLEVAQQTLEAAGYHVVAPDYPSTAQTVQVLAARAIPAAREACGAVTADPPLALTHSMGGILLRQWSATHPDAPWGPIVMLAPPNQGSELVDALGALQPFRWINGPAGMQLGTGPEGLPKRLPAVQGTVGVIAGTRSLNAYYSTLLPGEDDGKVTVASTKVAGMTDHIALPVTHTFLMNAPEVLAQVLTFFDTGAFEPGLDLTAALARIVTAE